MPLRLSLPLLLALAIVPFAAAPALAGGFVSVDGTRLVLAADASEPSNVTIAHSGDILLLDDRASQLRAGFGCTASADGYRVVCADTGIERIDVRTSDFGSDVRIRADLPADIQGGAGDDVLIGGAADDTIDGGGGQDVLGGGGGADLLRGGDGNDVVSYADRIGPGGRLLPRHSGVRIALETVGASGAPGEDDTIAGDVEQLQGTASADSFALRDGLRTSVTCGGGHDLVHADARDDSAIDCESTLVAPAPGAARLRIPALTFPFTRRADRARSSLRVSPLLSLRRGALALHVTCPTGVGLLERDGPGCAGRLRIAHGATTLALRRIAIRRSSTITLTVPLGRARSLARRAHGLRLSVTALPDRGHVQRTLRFSVRG